MYRYFGYLRNAIENMSLEYGECDEESMETCVKLIACNAAYYSRAVGNRDIEEDLIQEGLTGLAKAWQRYSPDKGCKLSTYAEYWIKNYIMEAVNSQYSTGIKMPKNLRERIWKVNKLNDKYSDIKNEDTRVTLIADELKLTKDKVYEYMELYFCMGYLESLDSDLYEEDETPLVEMIRDENVCSVEEAVMQKYMKEELNECLQSLNKREVEILKMRYGDEKMTFEDIGRILNISGPRVSQLCKSAFEKLLRSARCRALMEYLSA